MSRRFCNPKVTKYGRIGHPGPIDRRMVKCAGVIFEDRALEKMWTYRKYEAYSADWPECDVWTVQIRLPPPGKGKRYVTSPTGWGPQTPVIEGDVPPEVREYALAQLVRFRLDGRVTY